MVQIQFAVWVYVCSLIMIGEDINDTRVWSAWLNGFCYFRGIVTRVGKFYPVLCVCS